MLAKYFKDQSFHQKLSKISFLVHFDQICRNYTTKNNQDHLCKLQKVQVLILRPLRVVGNYIFCRFSLTLLYEYQKHSICFWNFNKQIIKI